jgi:hypothetical protein
MTGLAHDAYWIAWGLLLAVWARCAIPAFVALARRDGKTADALEPAVKTVRDTGGIRWPSGGMWQAEKWQVGA